jgi:hypothetical protein
MAEEALLGGLTGMPSARQDVLMTAQALTWGDLGQSVCAALMLLMTHGACLLTKGMVPTQDDRPMAIQASSKRDAGPRLMAAGAVVFHPRMCSRQRSIHEDPLVSGEPNPGQQGDDKDGAGEDRKGGRANGCHLSVRRHMSSRVRLGGHRDGHRRYPRLALPRP